jgi:hypothetical protein
MVYCVPLNIMLRRNQSKTAARVVNANGPHEMLVSRGRPTFDWLIGRQDFECAKPTFARGRASQFCAPTAIDLTFANCTKSTTHIPDTTDKVIFRADSKIHIVLTSLCCRWVLSSTSRNFKRRNNPMSFDSFSESAAGR